MINKINNLNENKNNLKLKKNYSRLVYLDEKFKINTTTYYINYYLYEY